MRLKLHYGGVERVLFVIGDESGAWLKEKLGAKFGLEPAVTATLILTVRVPQG